MSFDDSDQLNTKIVCQTSTPPAVASEYSGNRGITLIRDNAYTAFGSLATVTPSVNAKYDWLDAASFVDNQAVDVTVWLKGFLLPAKSSDYLFSVTANGPTKLFLSTNAAAANKVLVASYDPSNSANTMTSTTTLQAGQK